MICWSTDDVYLVTAATDYGLRVWDAASGSLIRILQVYSLIDI